MIFLYRNRKYARAMRAGPRTIFYLALIEDIKRLPEVSRFGTSNKKDHVATEYLYKELLKRNQATSEVITIFHINNLKG